MNDDDIVRRLRSGDEHGLVGLLERYGGVVQTVLRRRFETVLDHDERMTAFDDAVLGAWRHAQTFDIKEGHIEAWFVTIALNAARTVLRQKTRTRSVRVLSGGFMSTVPGAIEADDPDLVASLESCMAELSLLQQRIVRADLRGYASADDLAEELGSTSASIHVQRHRARQSLRECLGRKGYVF